MEDENCGDGGVFDSLEKCLLLCDWERAWDLIKYLNLIFWMSCDTDHIAAFSASLLLFFLLSSSSGTNPANHLFDTI